MLLPLGTDRPLRRATVITWGLLVANVLVFAAQLVNRALTPEAAPLLEDRLALTPDRFAWWTLFTYAFVHANWWHLAGNTLFLWVFGPNIEDRFGRVGFLVFYLLGAAAAGGVHALVTEQAVIGASGAIAACTGAYFVLFPRATVRAFSLFLVVGMVQLPAWWFIGLSVLWDLLAHGFGDGTNVAHLAHLAGFGFGAAVAFALLGLKVLPREPYDVFSMARQAYRRQQIRSAVTSQQRTIERKWAKARAAPTPASPSAGPGGPAPGEALAQARARIGALIAEGDLQAAAAAYKRLAEETPAAGGATTLSRANQYALANHFYLAADHGAAVYAYERFLEAYPRDAEAPHIRLLLGRLNARVLNDPIRAKALLHEALRGLRDDESREMAQRELETLG